ncbi:HlyD family secretion protein [Duganella sp. LjRoot269]|jgi:membrane fusion protein (multidrug efflux system)|uniref:HlyD family secretion protein n=1 Tax=Duganella sp. LjRoot269 TaxID=3342305 RepID=UPI00159DE339
MTTPDTSPTDAASGGAGKALRIGAAALIASAVGAALWMHYADGGSETTEDAYVDGNVVQVTPQLGGTVTMIAADNTEFVAAGQILVQFNDVDARLALERSQAQLARAVRQVRAQFANATQTGANVALRASDLARAEADLARRRQLVDNGAISGEELTHAQDAVLASRAALSVAREQQSSARSLVDRTSIATHPDVQAAVLQLRDAYLANARTRVLAPVSGIVSKRGVQLGQRVNAGTPLMSIVPSEQMWVNANFKESQLRHLRIGQTVTLQADLYGSAVLYHGTIVGQDAGTGSAFSLLPAQNASGNWIKVVQRVPVRVAIAPQELAAHPLKLGLSMQVAVDTRRRDGAVAMTQPGKRSNYRTDVFNGELAKADELAARTIAANLGAAAAR